MSMIPPSGPGDPRPGAPQPRVHIDDPLARATAQRAEELARGTRAAAEKRRTVGRTLRIVLFAALLVIAGGLWWLLSPKPATKPTESWERRVAAGTKVTGPSLAVSPDGKWFALAWAEGGTLWWMRGTREATGRFRFDAPTAVPDQSHPFSAFDEDPPKAAIDDQGQVAVAWMTRPANRGEGSVIAVARPNLDRDGAVAITRIEPTDPAGFYLCESIQYDDDGGLLAVWIDAGSAAHSQGEIGTLQCATAPAQGPFETTAVLADSICACCRTSVSWFGPDTFALSWRGVDPANSRDVRFAVLRERGLDGSGTPALDPQSRALVREDGWKIEGCPSHGPSIAAIGDKAAWVAWYTEGTPRGLSLAKLDPRHGVEGFRWATRETFEIDAREKTAYPYVVTLGSGRPLVVFEGPAAEGGRALFGRTMTRKGLGPPVRFTTATRPSRPVAVRWGGSGALVAWTETDELGSRLAIAEWKGL